MAELNRLKTRLLGNYNSLLDENLAEYFSNPRIRRHLLTAGLIRRNGEIVSPQDYKTRVLEEQRWLASQAFLAQAIVQRALDLEFSRRAHLQTQIEEIIRLELVERVRSARQKSQPSTRSETASAHCESRRENFAHKKLRSLPNEPTAKFSERDSTTFDIDACDSDSGSSDIKSHSSADFARQNKTRATCSANSRLQEKSTSPYSIPLIRTQSATYYMKNRPNRIRKGVLHFPAARAQNPGPKNVQYSYCEISLRFLGTRSFFSTSVNGGRQDVVIKQQLAGGNPAVVFYEPLVPGSVFSFVSKRYADFPFSVTIYVDNILALKLSACCEYKYTVGYRLGGPQGYFMLLGVHGSTPCVKCNPKNKKKKISVLPPVKNKLTENEIDFKPSTTNNTSTWSQRPYSSKKVALISPSGKPNDKTLKSRDSSNSSWILNVGISPWVETNVDNLKCSDVDYKEQQTHTASCLEKENLSEDEIAEEIPLATALIEDSTVAAEIEEKFSGEKEAEESASSDSDSNSTAGSSSGSSYTTSRSSSRGQETAVDGPKIQVINADGTERSRSSGSGSESSSSSSGSEEESDDDRTFLKAKDAQIIGQEKLQTIKEVSEKSEGKGDVEIPAGKREVALQKMVAIDSSDDEDAPPEIQQTIVHADIHNSPENIKKASENNGKNDKNKFDRAPSVDRQLSIGNGASSGRRNSICQIVRNLSTASEDGERDFPDMDSQSSSVQDNGIVIEIIGQDISGQISELCEELQYRPDLITLTISKGGIDDLNIVPVIDALIYSNCPLKSLNLNFNRLGPQAGQQIARLVREKPTLHHLFLRANPLHDSGLCPIVNALLAHNSNNLQNNDASFGLHTLDVGDCNFRNEGATNLASLIEQSRNLSTLILTGNNQLNDDDWSSIFWAVGQNSQVSTLFVDYCYIGDDGIDCLTGTIQHHPSLQALDLEWNQIGDEGSKLLLNWIKQNPKLTQVRLECGNNIKEIIVQDINKALESNAK